MPVLWTTRATLLIGEIIVIVITVKKVLQLGALPTRSGAPQPSIASVLFENGERLLKIWLKEYPYMIGRFS